MKRRIAVVSTDGKVINQHFGRAEAFHVFEIDNNAYSFVETRKSVPCCQEFDHTNERFDRVLDLLSDCKAVLAAKIGDGASQYLINHGMEVFQAVGPVTAVIEEIIRTHALDE